jgi:hypothetical protein
MTPKTLALAQGRFVPPAFVMRLGVHGLPDSHAGGGLP